MLSYFKSLQPSSILAFLLAFFIVKLPLLFGTAPAIVPVPNFWNSVGAFQQDSFFLNVLPAQLCLLGQAVWLNYLFHRADYHDGSSMIPALYFTLVTSLLPQFNVLSIYTVITFVLLSLFQTFLTITIKENSRIECFNAGMLGGILCLMSVHFVLFIPFLFLILYAIKPFRFNEYLMLFFGLLFPWYIALALSYLLDMFVNLDAFNVGLFQSHDLSKNVLDTINISLAVVYLLFAFVSLRGIMYSTGFKRRKNLNMLIFFFVGMVLIITFSGNLDETVLSLLFIPLSIFLTLFMLRIRKKKLGETLNVIFVLVTFITNIVRLFK